MTFTELFESLDEETGEEMEEILDSLSAAKAKATFGPLYRYMRDDSLFDIRLICEQLKIPTQEAYFDAPDAVKVYFSPMGGDQAWEILRPALQKYMNGVEWLRTQVQ